jgi:hypothetical protein
VAFGTELILAQTIAYQGNPTVKAYFLRNEILEIFSRFDPNLLDCVAPDEFTKVAGAVRKRLNGNAAAGKDAEDWHPHALSSNKYFRVQVCLAKAIRDNFGEEYISYSKSGASDRSVTILPRLHHNDPKLLEKAGRGIHLAELYCCIYFYLHALGRLSLYPAVRKNDILVSLDKANKTLACPDIYEAIELVNDLPETGLNESSVRGLHNAIPVGLIAILLLLGVGLGLSKAIKGDRVENTESAPLSTHSQSDGKEIQNRLTPQAVPAAEHISEEQESITSEAVSSKDAKDSQKHNATMEAGLSGLLPASDLSHDTPPTTSQKIGVSSSEDSHGSFAGEVQHSLKATASERVNVKTDEPRAEKPEKTRQALKASGKSGAGGKRILARKSFAPARDSF